MNCSEATKLLNPYADRELGLAESLEVERHIEGCAVCGRAYAALQALRDGVARHGAMPAMPRGVRDRLLRLAERESAGGRGAWTRSPLVVAAPGIAALVLAGWMLVTSFVVQSPAPASVRVVYHISDSARASSALRNLSNHLQATPDAKVVVVAHNDGVDFLLDGAVDESGREFAAIVREYRERGVEFRVCRNTLVRRGIADAKVVPGAQLVPSGIAEIGRLQSEEGYAYMRL